MATAYGTKWINRVPMLQLFRFLGLAAYRCPLCKEISEVRKGLCQHCQDKLAPRTGGYCPRCGKIFGLASYPPTVCSDCQTSPPLWGALFFYAVYEEQLRELILSYKFAKGLQHSRLLQELALAAYNKNSEKHDYDLLIPIPLHWKRLLWRGFNQSLELAKFLARKQKIPLSTKALQRVKHTPPQSTLPLQERTKNLCGAFQANADLVHGKKILLIDDVMTTGTTLRECSKVLLQAGALNINILVLARA